MADPAHDLIDRKLSIMEKRLERIYSSIAGDVERLSLQFLEQFKRLDEEKREMVAEGTLSPGKYAHWRRGKILYSNRFDALKTQISAVLEHTNEVAMAYINDQLPEVYAIGYNALEREVDGVGGYSFTLTDANTVKHLATSNKNLLPRKKLDPKKDKRWNMRNVNQSVLRSIVIGESIPDMAKRLRGVEAMNRVQAIRTARTLTTEAENKGRQDGYQKAVEDGIVMQKYWIHTHDGRTREEHIEAGRYYSESRPIPIDECFVVDGEKLLHPGDTSHGASGHNIYNCRCTTGTVIVGFRKRDGGILYV